MKFGLNQKKRFNCSDGAYSTITDREDDDSQITLTDHEARIVLAHFGESTILRGGVKTNPPQAARIFHLYPTGDAITLNLNFPKRDGNELRLYLNKQFKPDAGAVAFLFEKDERLWIGAMSESEWRAGSADIIKDESDGLFQESLTETSEIRIATLKERDIYVRDRRVALTRMESSGYLCEFDYNHELFISRRSGKPYLEAHHLIPMEFQPEFRNTLDVVSNVFCLCPNCHRAVHHAQPITAKQILDKLTARRDVLTDFEIDVNDLHALYGVEDII